MLDQDKTLASCVLDKQTKMASIHKACHQKDVSLVKLLVERGADVDSRDSRRLTPLMIAAANAHHDEVVYLLKAGARIDLEDASGKTAREHAIEAKEETERLPEDKSKKVAKLDRLVALNKIIPLLPRGLKEGEADMVEHEPSTKMPRKLVSVKEDNAI